MKTSETVKKWLVEQGGVEGPLVLGETAFHHFGGNAGEKAEDMAGSQNQAGSDAVVVPLPLFTRLRATGSDRARFLHNFCTNNVKALSPGQSCEAFFTDAKARVLAHGWILAGEAEHEIWMLNPDAGALCEHQNKYIIMDDVAVETLSTPVAGFAICGTRIQDALVASQNTEAANALANSCGQSVINGLHGSIRWLKPSLSEGEAVIFSLPEEDVVSVLQDWMASGIMLAGYPRFDLLRIRDRLPVFGIDLLSDTMAPEADRNKRSISYSKGCYLGQEPIARIDAMGHVNKCIRRLTLDSGDISQFDWTGASVQSVDGEALGKISSWQQSSPTTVEALAMLRTRDSCAGTGVRVLCGVNAVSAVVVKSGE
ncbi:MAG: hypothetical protein KDA91_00595 [Planctomycetaceae bacterium]|nr:hypothetical protein [Planctomycetaceae bacterium]